jgi:hypothetical protein
VILAPEKDQRVAWAFWVAGVLAVFGGITPLVLGGGFGGRLAGVLFPFLVAAAAMAANAVFHYYGRLFTIILYFVGGIAIVYGVLGMLAVKLTLLVAGSCDPAPAACPPGFQRPLTTAESDTITVVVILGGLAILAGFVGLMLMYRRRPVERPPVVWPTLAPAPAPGPPQPSPPPPAPPTAEPVAAPAATEAIPSAVDINAKAAEDDELKELPAPEEPLERPAPEEPKELPPPA